MALTVNNTYLASEFIALKARVKAECARRKYTGSVETYASSAYDYTVVPTSGGVVLPEHVNKLVVPMNAIKNTGITAKSTGDVIVALNQVATVLADSEACSFTSSSTRSATYDHT